MPHRRPLALFALFGAALIATPAGAKDAELAADLAAFAAENAEPFDYGGGLYSEGAVADGATMRWRLSFPNDDFNALIFNARTQPAFICNDTRLRAYLARGARIEMTYVVRGSDREERVLIVQGVCGADPEATIAPPKRLK